MARQAASRSCAAGPLAPFAMVQSSSGVIGSSSLHAILWEQIRSADHVPQTEPLERWPRRRALRFP